MIIKFKHILTVIISVLGYFLVNGQGIADNCMFTLSNGNDFTSSGDISNSGGADGGFYNGSSWTGASTSVAAPYPCDNPRAVFIGSTGNVKDAVGFRLNGNLTAGTFFNVNTRYIQTNGPFSIGVYTSNSADFYTDGVINATQVSTVNAGFNAWQNGSINFTVPPASAGHNWVFLRAESGAGGIANFCQFGLQLPTVDLGPDQEICEGEQVVLNASNADSSYEWNTGASSSNITVTEEDTYSAIVTNTCGSASDEAQIVVFLEPELNVTQDTLVCAGTELILSAEGTNPSYVWNDGSTDPTFLVDSIGVYSVTVTDDCFITSDTVAVDYLDPPELDFGPDTAVCGGTVDYNITNGGPTSIYSWSTGSESPFVSITTTGNYEATITNLCGTVSDQIFVEFSYSPGDFMADSLEFCEGLDMIVDVSDVEGYFDWSDGSTNPIFTVPNEGWHYATILDDDSCWTVSDTIFIDRIYCDCPMHIANSFTPNGDGINETYKAIFECPPYDFELAIYDRWGRQIFYTKDPEKAWTGEAKGGRIHPSGVYTYTLRYTNEFNGFINASTGSVFLMKD
ncbi:MAG: gliding motility-associated C-terminal domain-containing protein [Flavobacteriales bacterium]